MTRKRSCKRTRSGTLTASPKATTAGRSGASTWPSLCRWCLWRSEASLRIAAVLRQHLLVGVHVHDGGDPAEAGRVAVEVQVVGQLRVPGLGDPGADGAGAQPDVVIV